MTLIVHIAVAIRASLLCIDRAPAAEREPGKRPTLRVPLTDSRPVVDGKLEEPRWKDAARTGRGDKTTKGTGNGVDEEF